MLNVFGSQYSSKIFTDKVGSAFKAFSNHHIIVIFLSIYNNDDIKLNMNINEENSYKYISCHEMISREAVITVYKT